MNKSEYDRLLERINNQQAHITAIHEMIRSLNKTSGMQSTALLVLAIGFVITAAIRYYTG